MWLFSSTLLCAAETASDFQVDPVEDWTARLLGWAFVVAIILTSYALYAVLKGELNGVPGKVEASPPKHLSSAVGQMSFRKTG